MVMGRKFVIGDVHGRARALKEVLGKAGFDYDNDKLILLGDIVDGGYNTNAVVRELSKVKKLVFVIGNHDKMFMDFLFKGATAKHWLNQGGASTLNSYGGIVVPNAEVLGEPYCIDVDGVKIPRAHVEFFARSKLYHVEDDCLFVHAGIDPRKTMSEQDEHSLLWDRKIIEYAEKNDIEGFEKVYIGHTTTQHIEREILNFKCRGCGLETEEEATVKKAMHEFMRCPKCKCTDIFQSLGCTKPVKIGNLVCVDTGAGWDGRLTMLDVDSEKYYQSSLQEPPIV